MSKRVIRSHKHASSLGVLAIAAGVLGAGCNVEDESVDARGEAVNESRVLDFESLSDWSGTAAPLTLSSDHTQGTSSIATANLYYTEVVSVPIGPLGAVGPEVSFDFFLPAGVSSGSVKLILESSQAQIWYITVGQKDFSAMPPGQFNTVKLPLANELRTKLSGQYTDLKLRVVIQGSQAVSTPYRLDKMSFTAAPPVDPSDLVETSILSRWSAHSTEVATNTVSVLTGSQALVGSNALRAETNTGFDFWLEYASPTLIDASAFDYLRMSIRALNTTPTGWQGNFPVVVLIDQSGARRTISPAGNWLGRDGASWVDVKVPLIEGVAGWTSTGSIDMTKVSRIELHADTWESGFRLDVDGVAFWSGVCTGTPATVVASATSKATTATLSVSPVAGAVGYEIYRATGSGQLSYLTRSGTTTFEDSGLSLGTSYRYEARPVMASGCTSGAASVSTTTLASASGLTRIPTLKVLVPIYRGGAAGYTDAEVARLKKGIELGREFYFRNTQGKLNLALDYLVIDAAGPDALGPTMANIETDLRARGITDLEYDAIYGVARDLGGCWGGFGILGGVGAFGVECSSAYPTNATDVDEDIAWTFTHEFQHALDRLAELASSQDMIGGHPDGVYQDQPYFGPIIDAGEHFDWEAATLRAFTGYDSFASPFDSYLEVVDSDGDGLANADSRLPMDELRFNSRTDWADTDSDGLSDRAEYGIGRFASSNPNAADTDGDGMFDGVDPSPRAAIPSSIAAASPIIDGVRDAGYTLFRDGLEFSEVSGFAAKTHFAYDANYVYVFAETNQTATMVLILDGSGANGFWQGDNTYSFTVSPGATRVLNHTSRHSTEETGVALADSLVATTTSGGKTFVEARIPRANLGQGYGWTGGTTTGFSTTPGSVLGLRIWFGGFGGLGNPFSFPWATQNEYFHFDDVTLN